MDHPPSMSWKAVACSLFLLAMSFTSIGSVHARQANKQVKAPSTSIGNVTFTLQRMQDGHTENGGFFDMTVLSTSHGATIYDNTISYHKASDADQEVERTVHLSTEVIRQGKETDEKGRITRRWFLIRLPSDKSSKYLVWLVWSAGKTVHEVGSDSLDDLLTLEHMPSVKGAPPK